MASAPASAERSLSTCPVPPEVSSGGGFHSLGAGLRLDYLEPLRSRPGRLQAVFGEQWVVDHLHLMGLDLATPSRAEGALPGRRCGVVDAGDERQAYPQPASLPARQSLEDLGAAVFDLLDLGQADHQWPAQALGEEEGQHPGAFPVSAWLPVSTSCARESRRCSASAGRASAPAGCSSTDKRSRPMPR